MEETAVSMKPQPRKVSAIRSWPPGCGRFASSSSPPAAASASLPSLDPDLPIIDLPPSPPAVVSIGVGISLEPEIYPPPKRRSVSAIRHWPVGCGREVPHLVDSSAATAPNVGSAAAEEGGIGFSGEPATSDNHKSTPEPEPEPISPAPAKQLEKALTGIKRTLQAPVVEAHTLDDCHPEVPIANFSIAGASGDSPVEVGYSGKEAISEDHKLLPEQLRKKMGPRQSSPGSAARAQPSAACHQEELHADSIPIAKIRDTVPEQDGEIGYSSNSAEDHNSLPPPLELRQELILEEAPAKQLKRRKMEAKKPLLGAATGAQLSYELNRLVMPVEAATLDDPKLLPLEITLPSAPAKLQKRNTVGVKKSFPSRGVHAADELDKVLHQVSRLTEKQQKRKKVANSKLDFTLIPSVPPNGCESGNSSTEPRRRVRSLLQKFQQTCRKLMQQDEASGSGHGGGKRRIDLRAVDSLKDIGKYVKNNEPIVGLVPGVEIGDEFHFRVELSIVDLHRPYQAGIDFSKIRGENVALSIVASGGYHDEFDDSGILTYTGAGGKPDPKKKKKNFEDQKLERGNLALYNNIATKTPVRVIHGFKSRASSSSVSSMTFTYDGLYTVVRCWEERTNATDGCLVYKFELRRAPNQPKLAVSRLKGERGAIRMKDISGGKERVPIAVVNTLDEELPLPFEYLSTVIYPPGTALRRGCDCVRGCGHDGCTCTEKNGGEIPYNLDGAIVEAKMLIYECGPSCRCPPTCPNRVSQRGIHLPLEIFKTRDRGWGVRSLCSIPSGTFVCEYVGEILEDHDADYQTTDEYLFDLGTTKEEAEECEGGFTIDAGRKGNVGRFVNHSCDPNMYAQNVMCEHEDERMPHVMLFATENIPAMKELTYHYNYSVNGVMDAQGVVKRKECYCGASECTGRLY